MDIKFKNVNEKLLDVYEKWEKALLTPYIKQHTNAGYYSAEKDVEHERDKNKCSREGTQISCPFYMGLTDNYINSDKKRVMIVGQEARGYGIYTADKNKKGYNPESSQRWAKFYLSKQIDLQEETDEFKLNYNYRSRFWALFRALKDTYALCWTDIDKVYYNKLQDNKDGKYKGTLTYGGEAYLNKRYGEDNKSILEREIDLAKPDCIVFVIGPSYYVSLEQSFGIENKPKEKLTTNPGILDVSKYLNLSIPAFWTYHPANRSKVNVIDKVTQQLNNILK